MHAAGLVFSGIAALGCIIGAVTGSLMWLAPSQRARRDARRLAAEEDRKVRLFILGSVAQELGGQQLSPGVKPLPERLATQDTEISRIQELLRSAPLLNGKGDMLVRDVGEMKEDMRRHLANSELTHAALWAAIRDSEK